MSSSLQLAKDAYSSYAQGLWHQITHPSLYNYFYWLLGVSVAFFALESLRPWRKDQPKFRKDFWLDAFYMFFNFFLFSLIIYNAVSTVVVDWFHQGLSTIGINNLVAIHVENLPVWAKLLILFVVRDFIQWNIHRLLHRVPALWEFHKVHHSVKEMGFAAHLRFHWMESVIYRVIQYLPLALIGFGIQEFFIVHAFTTAVGHFNHSNIRVPLGPLRYLINNPQMHIWHHAKKLPKEHRYGMNFGLTLSIWDYLFKTAYVPSSGRDIDLGFHDEDDFPKTFWGQLTHGFSRKKKN